MDRNIPTKAVINPKPISTPQAIQLNRLNFNDTKLKPQEILEKTQRLATVDPPRSISNIRTNESIVPLMIAFQHDFNHVKTNIDPNRQQVNLSPSIREKHMKKLKHIIQETTGNMQLLRNRSVSIESLSYSPPKEKPTLSHKNIESGRPTEGSSNERNNSEESLHHSSKFGTNTKSPPLELTKKKERRSLISPPGMDPQNAKFSQIELAKGNLHKRVIKNIGKHSVLRKNFSNAQIEDISPEKRVSALGLPDEKNYQNLVAFTENLRQALVMPTTRCSNLNKMATIPNIKDSSQSDKNLSTPKSNNPQSDSSNHSSGKLFTISTKSQTTNSGDLKLKLQSIHKQSSDAYMAENRATSLSKYIMLKPRMSEDSNFEHIPNQIENYSSEKSSESMLVDEKNVKPGLNKINESEMAAKGYETERNIIIQKINPVNSDKKVVKGKRVILNKNSIIKKQKGIKLVRKILKDQHECGNYTPQALKNLHSNNTNTGKTNIIESSHEIKDFSEMNLLEEIKETIQKPKEIIQNDSKNITQIDYNEIREKFNIQKGEEILLFPVLKCDTQISELRIGVSEIFYVDSFDISK